LLIGSLTSPADCQWTRPYPCRPPPPSAAHQPATRPAGENGHDRW